MRRILEGMNKRACLLVGSVLLFGCTGRSESESSGGGGSSSTTTSSTSTSSTSTSQGGGGSGGGLIGGSGGTTTDPLTACAQVLDKGWYVSFTVDGQAQTPFTDSCASFSDGMGPMAAVFHGKGGPGWFQITACPTSDVSQPRIELSTDHPETPGAVTSLYFTDAGGVNGSTATAVSTFNVYGPAWTSVSGNFDGKIIDMDGTTKTVSGSFLVCRRPDVYAP